MGIGGILGLGSVFLLPGKPSQLSCFVRPALVEVSFTTLFGTLALKTWRIYRIFEISLRTVVPTDSTKSISTVAITNQEIYTYLMLMLGVDALLICLKAVVSPPWPEFVSVAKPPFGDVLVHRCAPADVRLDMITLSWKGLIAAVLLVYAFKTRHVIDEYGEARNIFISANQLALCCIVYFSVVELVRENARGGAACHGSTWLSPASPHTPPSPSTRCSQQPAMSVRQLWLKEPCSASPLLPPRRPAAPCSLSTHPTSLAFSCLYLPKPRDHGGHFHGHRDHARAQSRASPLPVWRLSQWYARAPCSA